MDESSIIDQHHQINKYLNIYDSSSLNIDQSITKSDQLIDQSINNW